MKEWFPRMIDRIFAVIGALVFLQIPLFIQQYSQRLSGHLEELRYQVGLLNEVSTQSGKTLQEFISKFVHSSDLDFSRQGELLQAMIQRLDKLNNAYLGLHNSTLFTKPFVFMYYSDWEILRSTMTSYKVGVPLSIEGLIYGIIGIFVGYFAFTGISKGYYWVKSLFTHTKHSKSHTKKAG